MPTWLHIPGYMALGEWSHHRDYLGHENLFCTVLLCILSNMYMSIPISRLFLPLSLGNNKFVFYICDSICILEICSFLPFFRFHIQATSYAVSLSDISLSMTVSDPCLLLQITLFCSFFLIIGWAIFHCIYGLQDFPGGSDGKAAVCNMGDPGSIPGLGRSPGEGNDNALQYYCLENPTDGGAW